MCLHSQPSRRVNWCLQSATMGDSGHSGQHRRMSGDEYIEPDSYKRVRLDRAGMSCLWLLCFCYWLLLSKTSISWLLSL